MRRMLVAGNWKMNLTANEARALVAEIRAAVDREAQKLARDRDLMIAPAAVLIPAVSQALAGSSVLLGAQNMHFEEHGAFTGEISAPMLRQFGVAQVIVGHSERRHIFGESDDLINRRLRGVLSHRMTAILCVGETREEHESGRSLEVVLGQVERGLLDVESTEMARVVIAYEPVWAIGTGLTATPEQAEEVHAAIRRRIRSLHGEQTASATRIIYGGSVKPENIDSLASRPDIDGALVGGASLKAEAFVRIARTGLD